MLKSWLAFFLFLRPTAFLRWTTNRTKSTNFIVQGAATIKEFYAKNSRWTEGLISAAKAVGWGATEMV